MSYEDFDKLKTIYTQLIELVCTAKESNTMDGKLDCFFKMFQIVRACLEFSPYTHFYTQVLIDIIVKTYNSKVFRTDLLFKSQIGVFIENPKYYAKELYEEIQENPYTIELILHEFTYNIEYEAKRVFDIHYLNTNPAHAIFLDTKFKTKYVCDKELSLQERRLDVEDVVKLIKEKHMAVEEVYELENTEEQIRFELFKVIQNNFTINKCENCGKLFIPVTSSKNPNQKGRNDQKYCNNLYLDTGKTCKEIGAIYKQKEKVQNSSILKEYNREYKRMHGLHYNHTKEFKEKQFKEWSEKARELRDTYTNEQIEDFKIELKKLSNLYWK